MADTYTQIHIHAIFAVKNRQSLITEDFQDRLFKYIISIFHNNGHKVLSINGMPDHIHILFGLKPTQSLSKLIQEVKRDSSEWVNKNHLVRKKFAWQSGYGAFSYSKSQLTIVSRYILNQKKHHQKKSFIDEYSKILQNLGIEYDARGIFTEVK